jgi:hypothetical protein
MDQRIDGVGDEDERYRDANDAEASAWIVRGGTEPVSYH